MDFIWTLLVAGLVVFIFSFSLLIIDCLEVKGKSTSTPPEK